MPPRRTGLVPAEVADAVRLRCRSDVNEMRVRGDDNEQPERNQQPEPDCRLAASMSVDGDCAHGPGVLLSTR